MLRTITLIGVLCLSASLFSQTKTNQSFQKLFTGISSKKSEKALDLRPNEKRARKAFLKIPTFEQPFSKEASIQLNLFEDVQLDLKLQKETRTFYKNIQVWKGRTDDPQFSHLPQYRDVIVVYNPNTKKMAGMVEASNGAFSFLPDADSKHYRITEMQSNHFQCSGGINCKKEEHLGSIQNNAESVTGCDDIDDNGDYIMDIFIGFSESAETEIGDINTHAILLVETVNTGFTNSLVNNVKLRLVSTGTTPNNPGVVTSVLSDGWEWFASEVETTGADFLAVIQTYTGVSGERAGWAYKPGYISVINTGLYAFRHEFGHNMGGSHCPGDGGIEPYAHGYNNGNWKTYLCGNDHNFYSTPLVNDNLGNPIGDAATADMARLIGERKNEMSHRRIHRVPFDVNDIAPCSYDIPLHTGGSENDVIFNVAVGTINNASGGSWNNIPQGFSDYTNLSTQVESGISYNMTVTVDDYEDWGDHGDQLGVWVDWNQDFLFQADEQIAYITAQQVSSNLWTFSFTPPSNAAIGTTTMRVRYHHDSYEDLIEPYANTNYSGGETEDYSLEFISPCTLTFYADWDGDGYGDPNNTVQACSAPYGYISDFTDCNDIYANIYPSAPCFDGDIFTENDQYDANCNCAGTLIACNDNLMAVKIFLDDDPDETTWKILDDNGVTVASGGDYETGEILVYSVECLPDGCYTFLIEDSSGDGICCANGPGYYSVEDVSGQVYASGGTFEDFEYTHFCVNTPACSDHFLTLELQLDDYPEDTSWDIKDMDGNVIYTGGTYAGQFLELMPIPLCLSDGCYEFTIYDSWGDGICCSYGDGYYAIKNAAGEVLITGDEFDDEESKIFCLNPAVCTENVLTLELQLDDDPEETTWDIKDSNGNYVYIGGPYDDQILEYVEVSICLPEGCFDFTIHDSYGDGICCSNGPGYYTLKDASGQILASGDEFDDFETTNFCLGSGGGGCNTQLIDSYGFESGWGIWNDGGVDCRKNANDAPFANTGTFCVRLRDNTSASVMTTDNLDLSGFSEITVDFSFQAESFENTEDFWLQLSTDGGATFTTVEDWVRTIDFQNSERHNPSVTIAGPFSNNSQLRFRCDASGNGDKVYIDDVVIEGYTSAGNNMIISNNGNETLGNSQSIGTNHSIANNGNQLEEIYLFPNPVSSQLTINYRTFDNAHASIKLVNLTGQVVWSQAIELSEGLNEVQLNVSDFPEGVYLLSIQKPNSILTRQLVIAR